MEVKATLMTVAVAALMVLSCTAVIFSEDVSAATASKTVDGVTVTYSESGSGASLHFSFASGSLIRGDSVDTKINNKEYGNLNFLMLPDFNLGAKCSAVSISLSQDGHSVSMTLTPGSGHAVIINQSANGTISADKYAAEAGETVTLTAAPAPGYGFVKWTISPSSVQITNNTFRMPAQDVTVSAEFALPETHMVNVEVQGNGSAVASQTLALSGASITLTVNPSSERFEFKEWKDVSPSSLRITKTGDTTYTFTMPSGDVSLKAVFGEASPRTYTIGVTPSEGGSVSTASGSAKPGTMVQFEVTPNTGYTVESVTSSQLQNITNTGNVYGFVMPAENVTVSVKFKAAQTYDVSVSSGNGGSVSSDVSKASAGQTVRLTLAPNTGYVFDSWTKAPSTLEVTKVDNVTYTFTMPSKAVSLTASFKAAQTYDVTAVGGAGGTVSVDKAKAFEGEKVTVTLVPENGYAFDTWDSKVPLDLKLVKVQKNVYTFDMPANAVSLEASFKSVTEVDAEVEYGSVSVRIGGDVTGDTEVYLSIEKVSPSLGNIPRGSVAYEVSITAKNGSRTVDLSKSVVTLYLDATSMDDSKTIYAFFVSDDGKTVDKMNASLTEDGEVRFVTNHNSLYVLSYEDIQPLEGDSSMLIIVGIAAVILVLIVAVLVVSRKKTKV